ncbi:unnamed protein product [Ceutorhynchus assimilis]|uniref:UDP-glucuronosyltransferase n=1 Tax=Ceutorhynchus assimilis TaxID=467358 RepID=A0A9N9MR30_9CUCU|nr:unnamed protein product [Ceutorhynchus assimilis]
MLIRTIFFVATALACTESYKILGIFPMAGISHYILASKLMKGLSEAGHDITMVSPFALKDLPKKGTFTDVVLDGMFETFQQSLIDMNLFHYGSLGPIDQEKILRQIGIAMANDTLHHPKMVKFAASNQKFDAVIMEQFTNDALKVYGYIFDCPVILLQSMGVSSWINNIVGNAEPVSYAPQVLGVNDISKDLSFSNRAENLYLHILNSVMTKFRLLPEHDKIIRSMYPEAPSMEDLYHNVSLVLVNSHTSIHPPLPLVPNVIEIGGYFVDPPKKLPEDLQEYLDNAPDGVIYFSMGSNIRSKDITPEKKQAILNVFGRLKEKVIWKFEENLPGKPSNVMIRSWCPQQDILAHPNVKLFISHSGLLSITEAIYHGVPILCIPVFGDQPANAQRAVMNGYALRMDYLDPDFNEEKLGYLVNELLTNPTYRDTAKEKSRIYHDRPMKPMESVVYWVEYVIRHKGAPHLRVAGALLPWYKYYMVDVLGTFVASFLLVLYILIRLIKNVLSRTKKVKTKTTKKDKKH